MKSIVYTQSSLADKVYQFRPELRRKLKLAATLWKIIRQSKKYMRIPEELEANIKILTVIISIMIIKSLFTFSS